MKGDVREIGARIMVGVRGGIPGDAALETDLDACERVGVGGVVLFDRDVRTGEPRNVVTRTQVATLVGHIRERLGASVCVAVDQEGGRVARLRGEHGFTTLPAAREFSGMSPDAQRSIARAMAQELRDVGIDMNCAPCVDLDLGCPVISGLGRSFGGIAEVEQSAKIVIEELQGNGVMACVKHFPGHGSARVDSHAELPDITDDHLKVELAPYLALLRSSAPPRALMTGHLLHRMMDPEHPASVSRLITTGMIRDELGFAGLVVTDSIDMGALRLRYSLPGAMALALEAGADIVMHACNSPLGETAEDVARAVELLAQG